MGEKSGSNNEEQERHLCQISQYEGHGAKRKKKKANEFQLEQEDVVVEDIEL